MATDNDDYEILPQKELIDLKKQMEDLKGGPSSKKLMESMEDLKHTISELIELFKATSQELKVEEKEEASVHKKLDKLASQQKVIAEAILSLSDKIGSHAESPAHSEPAHEQSAPLQQFSAAPQQPFTPQSQPFTAQPSFSSQPFGQAAPEPFTPRPFSLGQDYGGRPTATPQAPPANPFQQGFSDPNQGGYGSPYGSAPSQNPLSGFPNQEDDLDDLLGEKKKKKGLFGAFRK